jgi:hypothetical protein
MKSIHYRSLYIIIITVFIFNVGCNIECNNQNKKKNGNYIKLFLAYTNNSNNFTNDLILLKSDIKQDVLSQYTNIRPKPFVLSKRETLDKLLDDAFSHPIMFAEILKKDIWEDSHLGDIILVDDYSLMRNYYYFIYIVDSKSNFIGMTNTVSAIVDNVFAGHFGAMCFTDSNKIPLKYMSDKEAINYLINKYSLGENEGIQIKAINIDNDALVWAWLIKLPTAIQVTSVNDEILSGSIFYVKPEIYDLGWFANKSESDKIDFENSLKNRTRLALIDKDLFNDNVSISIKKLNRNSTPDEIKNIYPKKVILENMAQ